MSTYDARLATLEKDVAVMKQDIIYKLDDTNSAVTVIKGVVGRHGGDIKYLINLVRGLDSRLDRQEEHLEGLTQEMRTLQKQQSSQGQDIKDIKRHLDSVDQRLSGIDQRFDGVDQRLDGIDQRFDKVDQRLDAIDQHLDGVDQQFASLEEKFDRRFEQVLQAIATLTKKVE